MTRASAAADDFGRFWGLDDAVAAAVALAQALPLALPLSLPRRATRIAPGDGNLPVRGWRRAALAIHAPAQQHKTCTTD